MEFEFDFCKRSSKIRTSFNIPSSKSTVSRFWRYSWNQWIDTWTEVIALLATLMQSVRMLKIFHIIMMTSSWICSTLRSIHYKALPNRNVFMCLLNSWFHTNSNWINSFDLMVSYWQHILFLKTSSDILWTGRMFQWTFRNSKGHCYCDNITSQMVSTNIAFCQGFVILILWVVYLLHILCYYCLLHVFGLWFTLVADHISEEVSTVGCVSLFVYFCRIFWTRRPSTLIFCMCVSYDIARWGLQLSG